MLEIKFKKLHREAKTPTQGTPGSAGWDLYAAEGHMEVHSTVFDTGIAIELPKGYVGLVVPRSSIYKVNHRLVNSVGVIDSDYRGTIKAMFDNTGYSDKIYGLGDRICQLIVIPYPEVNFVETDNLTDTARGQGGFGSTGGVSGAW